jgi:very-short-patch-repair endonuclease
LGEEVTKAKHIEQQIMKTSGVVRLQHISDDKLDQARSLRLNMTHAENLLWQKLRRRQLGVKFRRQQIIEGFIVDFYCESAKLVIEVDGAVHFNEEQQATDEHRRKVFEDRGLREIRFENYQIESRIDDVIAVIRDNL